MDLKNKIYKELDKINNDKILKAIYLYIKHLNLKI